MLSVSRMKTLISPTLSFFFPHISKHTNIPLSSPKSILNYPYYQILQSSNLYTLQPNSCIPKSPSCSLRRRTVKMGSSHLSSGEIHVIVGPMFAGKTTSLLRRIEQESSNGRLIMDKTLRGLCYSGRLTEAISLLCANGQQVEAATYALLLQECIHRKAYERGKIIHTQMVVVGHIPNEYLKTKLLILYAKLGDLETGSILFDRLMDKSLISWNAMIAGYVQKGNEEIGLNLYYEMRCSGLIPDHYTFASLFRACAALATLEHGKRAHCIMIKSQLKENVVVSSAIVDMYFKCSNLSDGHKVFNETHERNIVTWTALISGYGLHGKVVEVLESFHKMINDGFRPNYVTFLAVLFACSYAGLVDEGWKYFYSMTRDYGIQPRGPHYAAIVDLLGRAGRLEEAYEFVLNSPSKEHPVIWGALLGACRTHGDIDLVKFAARKYFQLEPENAGKYVVLSNAFAAFGLWDNVAQVRGVMKELGMVKEPGYSRIEVRNEVYFFCKGDKSHKRTEEIYEMIKSITCILKDFGNVAVIKSNKDTRYGLDSIVTHDGVKLPCFALADLSSFRQKFGLEAYDKLDVIGIDEAQFFEDLHDFCREAADRDGKIVIVAGLDGDYLRRSFGSVLNIIPLADSVTKLSARCELCGKRALFTLRKTDETRTELIGGADIYMPVCRQHYVSGQAVIETTRSVLESQSKKVQCG